MVQRALEGGALCLPNGQVVLDAGNYSTFNWSTGETTQQISVNTLGGSYSVNVTDVNGCPGISKSNVYFLPRTSVIVLLFTPFTI